MNRCVEDSVAKFQTIYLENGAIISRKKYPSLRDIQDEFETYKASLGYPDIEGIIAFLKGDMNLNECQEKRVREFAASGRETITLDEFFNGVNTRTDLHE